MYAIRSYYEGVSSLVIVHTHDAEEGRKSSNLMAGMLTDRDLRNRVIARGLSYDTPVNEIMTSEVIHGEHNQLVFEAMLAMLRHNVHHLPILKHGELFGIVSQSDRITSYNVCYTKLLRDMQHFVSPQ